MPVLVDELRSVLDVLGRPAEIVFVDDASTDGSAAVIRRLAACDARVRLVRFSRHGGLSAALYAGFQAARGDILVTLDADLQNDPRDLVPLLDALADADAVIGWRRVRRDPWLRRASSAVANAIRNAVTGDRIRDGGCGLRAIRRHCLGDLPAFDGMHRFIATLLRAAGRRVAQVPARHRPRRFGRSHFGIRNRALVTFIDLLAVRWLLARRLSYEVDTGETRAVSPVGRGVRNRGPARAHGVARRLAVFWIAAAVLLGGWALVAGTGPGLAPDAGLTEATLFPRRPPGEVITLWLHWDAAAGEQAWAVLETARPRAPSDALSWRRRIHPGWNQLVWSDVPTLPADEPIRLAFDGGPAGAWRITALRADGGYGLHHLTSLRGLLLALGIAAVAGVAGILGPRPRRSRARWWWAAVGAAAAIAAALRLHTLALQSFWFDEVLTAIGAQSLAWVVHTQHVFGHPPLYYLAAWAVSGGATDEWSLRMPSFVAGVATVVAVAWLGHRLFGPLSGLAAALALSVSPFHVELSQLARPYAVFLLLTVLSLGALLKAIERGRTRDWLLFSALLGLGLYTHYLALQVFALEGLTAAILLARRRWRGLVPAALSFTGAALLLSPWLPVLRRLGATQLGQGDLPAQLLHELVARVFAPQFLGPGLGTVIGLALLGCGIAALVTRPALALVALLWLALPPVVLWLLQPAHFVAGRHLAFALPMVMLLLGHGVAVLAGASGRAIRVLGEPAALAPRLATAVAMVVVAAGVVAWSAPSADTLRHYYQWRYGIDWRTVATVLDRLIPEDAAVSATVGALYPLRHYWSLRVAELDDGDLLRPPPQGAEHYLVVAGGAWHRPPGLDAWLDTHGVRVGELPPSWSVPGLEIYRVRRTGAPARGDGARTARVAQPERPGRAVRPGV
ncbi:MAG: glycosyltransferase [Candidatus Rokubacteria bacterium]|nr:glycosyltransferase [Candidatus Rokubacteria bacterium]